MSDPPLISSSFLYKFRHFIPPYLSESKLVPKKNKHNFAIPKYFSRENENFDQNYTWQNFSMYKLNMKIMLPIIYGRIPLNYVRKLHFRLYIVELRHANTILYRISPCITRYGRKSAKFT